MVSRSSSCCRGHAGMAAPPLGAGQPLRTGARSWPRGIIAMICHGGAVGPSLRTEAAAAVPGAGEPVRTFFGAAKLGWSLDSASGPDDRAFGKAEESVACEFINIS